MQHLQILPLKLFLISLLAGFGFRWLAQTERERAESIRPEPLHLTCSELMAQPEIAIHHLTISDFYTGEQGAYSVRNQSDVFTAYVPIYPLEIEAEPAGENIQLLAKFSNMRSRDQFTQATKAQELTGVLQDTQQIASDLVEHLRSSYPKLNFDKCRMLIIGEPLPSIAQAETFQWISYGAFFMGACLIVPLLSRLGSRQLGISENPATVDPYSDPVTGESERKPDLKQQRIYSIAGAVLMTLSVAVCVGSMVTLQFGYASTGAGIGGLCAGFLGAVLGFWIMSSSEPEFAKCIQQRIAIQDLPKSARKYFDRSTPDLLALGFQYVDDIRQPARGMTIRKLLASDGLTIGELCSNADGNVPGFVSLTSDGVLHETTTVDVHEIDDPTVPWRVQMAKGSLTEMYAAHLAMVRHHATSCGVQLLAIAPDEILCVGDYNHHVAFWSRYRRGITSRRPPKLTHFESIAELNAHREARLAAELSAQS